MTKRLITNRWFVASAVLVVVAAAVVPLAGRVHRKRLHGLFEGTFDTSDESGREKGFYPGLAYENDPRWTGVVSRPEEVGADEESLLGRADADRDWEGGVERMHHDFKLDASSGATRLARLKSPSVYRGPWVPRFLTVTSPSDNAVFPPNLCAPFIEWNDVHNNFWQVRLRVPGEDVDLTFLTTTRRWRIPDNVWNRIRSAANGGAWATIEVRGIDREGLWSKGRESVHCSQTVRLTVSDDPADDAIIYRLVSPPFINKKTPDMFVRKLDETHDRLFLSAHEQYCLNCHTFSSKSGTDGKLCLQVRYLGGRDVKNRVYFAVYDLNAQQGRRTVLPFEIQMTTFMGWSPDGTKLAFSANQQIATFSPIVFETQWAGQPTSDIAVYDTERNDVVLLPGASGPEAIELYPCWTPDGKRIVFSSTRKGAHASKTKYDLCEIRYGDDDDAKAERVCDCYHKPVGWVERRTADGKTHRERQSSFYARFSPDGKWLSWVQADHGSLIKASSDVYLMRWRPRGEVKRLACNVPWAADSWHSWSSNSKWIVFASKRDDGIFARLYMTHIDDDGNASPAVRLPLVDGDVRVSFNIPEFVAHVPSVGERQLYENVNIDAESRPIRMRSREEHE